MSELTGRRRYRRIHWVLVLQVEYTVFEGDKWVCRWRDAEVIDVLESELA